MKHKETALDKITSALEFDRKIVGVKFLFSEDDFNLADAKPASVKIPYCVMVKLATHGHSLKAELKTSGCGGGTRALGLEKPQPQYISGCEYNSFGLYQDLAIAKNVVNNMTFCQHNIFGVLTKPLDEFTFEPDIVLYKKPAFGWFF